MRSQIELTQNQDITCFNEILFDIDSANRGARSLEERIEMAMAGFFGDLLDLQDQGCGQFSCTSNWGD